MSSQSIFQRIEKKYTLTQKQFYQLLSSFKPEMAQDEYGLHTIGSLYFDTDDFAFIRKSLEKPVYKEKLRLRSYGRPSAEDIVFLELKKKYRGIVYKRRVPLAYTDAENYIQKNKKPEVNNQIFSEIDWVLHMHHPQPKVYIAYERLAYFCEKDPPLRITFDQNIRWRNTHLSLAAGTWGTSLLDCNEVLMEIKTLHAIPLWLGHMLNELEIYPSSFSKYGACYQTYLAGTSEQGGAVHAS